MNPLPPLDRDKIETFLLTEKTRIALRDGRWLPKEKLKKYEQGRYDVVQEMIGSVVSGEWDQKVL